MSKKPLTGAERQKGFNIRHNSPSGAGKGTRTLKNSTLWTNLNSQGHQRKPKSKS